MNKDIDSIRKYWDARPLGIQYVTDSDIEIGTEKFFDHIRPWMNPYKFPWIMDRIERESKILQGQHLLEVGCGLGYDSVEFLKRGVRVTATDLTPTAVELAEEHFRMYDLEPEEVKVANALALPFDEANFDAVWANGVLHATGDTAGAIREVHRVLKPGGRAIISHFYRKPSWMYWLSTIGNENIEHQDEDPPVNEFLREGEILAMFDGFKIEQTYREHYRALPVRRDGVKAWLYSNVFKPGYNVLPRYFAERLAYKFSVTAIKST